MEAETTSWSGEALVTGLFLIEDISIWTPEARGYLLLRVPVSEQTLKTIREKYCWRPRKSLSNDVRLELGRVSHLAQSHLEFMPFFSEQCCYGSRRLHFSDYTAGGPFSDVFLCLRLGYIGNSMITCSDLTFKRSMPGKWRIIFCQSCGKEVSHSSMCIPLCQGNCTQ